MGGEQLNILINNYYGKKSNFFDAFSISQKIYFILQKVSMGFTIFILNITGSLVMKQSYSLLKRITKIYFYFSFLVIIFTIGGVEIFANSIANIYTNKQDIIEYIPGYIRIISLVIIPYHFENTYQSILSGHNQQKFASYFSLLVTIVGGLGAGYIFIFICDLGVYGVYITMFILEILFSIVNLIFTIRIKK